MKYKYIISNSYNPYYNLALETYLFKYIQEDEVLLYLWQNDNTVVIGKNQVAENECKIEDILKDGGTLARRMSGGGAVYHDLGNQNFSLISKSNNKDKVIFHEIITKALDLLGIQTEFNGRNDILINGKKFSGNAFYDNGVIYCQHGTILVNSNIQVMNNYLTPSSEKLKRNGINSVASRVGNLVDTNENITVDVVRKAIIQVVNAQPLRISMNEDELQKRIDFFSNEHWIYGGKK